MPNNKVFTNVSGLTPGRSAFDLSYEKKFTCDMGQLIPVMADELVPGDIFEMSNEVVARFQPLIAPILHEVNVYVHYFFVPYRLLWNQWEDFITGGVDGDFEATPPEWIPTASTNTMGSLWDYMGFPIDVIPDGAYPLDFPRSAYNFIFNEYYRDQTLQEPVELDQEEILNRAWSKGYFSAALPWQQRGQAPALPISGTTSAVFESASGGDTNMDYNGAAMAAGTNTAIVLDKNVVDLSVASTFDISDLRLAFQIQKWLERNARAGARYTEFLKAHFHVSPRDDRLDRPEFIGATKSPCIISEVLQTQRTDAEGTPQGNLAGHGITADRAYINKYRAEEFGIVMAILSVLPAAAYQQGIDRQWLRKTKYDFYFPEFANLSEQAILNAEIYASNDSAQNNGLFGYIGRFDEMRFKRNMVCSQMRTTFDYWHLGRQFDNLPVLNEEFVTCVPSKRIFAVQDEPGLVVNMANKIKAIRPMPIASDPGLVDHH